MSSQHNQHIREKMTEMNRRRFLYLSLMAMAGFTLPGAGIISCARKEPAIRIASNVWPGYELLYLARERKYFSEEHVQMVEMPSASVCIEALAAGTVEGACLTLDEVLTAKAEGLDLSIVTVLDISMGADVLLTNPRIKTLQGLKGKRLGVEQSAVGAVMLHAVLEKARLNNTDLHIQHMNVNRHRDAYLKGEVDALITFEPVVSQLAHKKPLRLFSSSDIPGRIVDVIAIRPEILETRAKAIQQLVAGHFRALSDFQTRPEEASPILAKRLKISPEVVPQTYIGLELPDITANHELLLGLPSKLENSANNLKEIMLKAQLLPRNIQIKGLVDGRFLPKV